MVVVDGALVAAADVAVPTLIEVAAPTVLESTLPAAALVFETAATTSSSPLLTSAATVSNDAKRFQKFVSPESSGR